MGATLANRWLVYTECELCELRLVIPAKAGTRRPETPRPGARDGLRPVGRSTICRRMRCPGRVAFWLRPHGASADVAMT